MGLGTPASGQCVVPATNSAGLVQQVKLGKVGEQRWQLQSSHSFLKAPSLHPDFTESLQPKKKKGVEAIAQHSLAWSQIGFDSQHPMWSLQRFQE